MGDPPRPALPLRPPIPLALAAWRSSRIADLLFANQPPSFIHAYADGSDVGKMLLRRMTDAGFPLELYKPPAIALLALLIVLSSAFAFGQTPSELSFKGLRLGMARQEVNQLVADTKWAYLTNTRHQYELTNAPDTSQSSGAVLSVESKDAAYDFLNPTDSFAVIGCKTANGYTECQSFNHISVEYFEDRVYEIEIYSERSAYKYPHIFHDFADMAVTAITNKYGVPTKKWGTDYSESNLILLKDDEIYRAAVWQWPVETKKVKPAFEITIKVDKKETDYEEKYHNDYEVIIDLVDKKAEARYLEKQQAENEKYQEEERHPKIKTDF